MSTIRTHWGSDTITLTANWAQASCQIQGDLEGGFQVADFCHNPRAALWMALAQCARIEGMSEEEAWPLIEAALSEAEEL